mmetsp:Transcript_2567/g.4186  ORF Transcript_2567/g.4186 Transcript_2567/m.4186 type:complete len:151 (+) Transcript_2567:61-513(+)
MDVDTEKVQFEDDFEVMDKDPDGKKFDRVSRFVCQSDLYDMSLTLDVNVEIYPMDVSERFKMLLTKDVNLGTATDKNGNVWENTNTIMDDYEYVLHGKIFKIETSQKTANIQNLYVSFGGLLMLLAGDPKPLESFKLDNNVYLLIRKTGT